MDKLTIVVEEVSAVHPQPTNPRTHSRKQIALIAESIRAFGFINPIIVDQENRIIAGHGRFEAAKSLGLKRVPTLLADHLNEAQKRAYALADNRIAEDAGWDKGLLRIEISYLLEIGNAVEISATGFTTPEIDLLINPPSDYPPDPPVPAVPRTSVSKPGDLWRLGRHRILCADATAGESYRSLMGRHRARLVFTDPPYNVPIAGHARTRSRTAHSEFAMASGEMNHDQFQEFLQKTLGRAAQYSRDGALHYVCMDWRHMRELLAAADGIYSELKNLCVWNKNVGGMGSFYRSKHELVFVFKYGTAPHVNNVDLGRFGRNRTNVWDYPGVGSFGQGRTESLSLHPTVKPLAMVADAILDATRRGDSVLDPFLGSGTTVLAAEKIGRTAFGLEIDPRYVDVALKRWWDFTGEEPVHDITGKTWSALTARRASKDSKEKTHARAKV